MTASFLSMWIIHLYSVLMTKGTLQAYYFPQRIVCLCVEQYLACVNSNITSFRFFLFYYYYKLIFIYLFYLETMLSNSTNSLKICLKIINKLVVKIS